MFKDVSGLTVYFPRILVIGPPNAGKTTVVRALCGNSVSVDTMGTTVAFDYGNLDLSVLGAESSVVVLANKSDLPGRLDEAAIRAGLGLAADVPVIPSVATTGQGTKEAVLALAPP